MDLRSEISQSKQPSAAESDQNKLPNAIWTSDVIKASVVRGLGVWERRSVIWKGDVDQPVKTTPQVVGEKKSAKDADEKKKRKRGDSSGSDKGEDITPEDKGKKKMKGKGPVKVKKDDSVKEEDILPEGVMKQLVKNLLKKVKNKPIDNISSQLKLHIYHTGRESRVLTALTLLNSHLFRYQGHVSAALVLGGVDVTGQNLYNIYPDGSTDTLPYATMESPDNKLFLLS
ncbi:peptidase T1A, proteasome beta-subunit [Artemisia annua]|uniref:Peptidase T1A, proteasome beta-subunit n=1 Tax=Artemisia annua TaxID=35608 RepID=A0A2U1PG20_ARTAN|nr:peptidase T1A, proteasome beta-subunit [Artemisia annua]